jgi:hypothetical protein
MLKIAIIKKCKKEDLDPNRSESDQKYCLYSKSTDKLLGRHPSQESARKQEQAIEIKKHGICILSFIIDYLEMFGNERFNNE